ncbi:OpgC domain-containing protein [Sphingomonas montanisoli]|uniref:Acyltransferase family protein n=1 Tax=Sphingomonas montanisoli TaxID=2606412 RepID=A0A5D9CCA6_9SPHN|nr:OpgC domain-containing protein [Sphingomonas montanisoli]TZG28967.1 acyltransferase family protein [Sphingomonas montanisoli]
MSHSENFTAPTTPPRERDTAIDVLRGLALITITINHITGFTDRMGLVGMQFPTLTLWGFSSAAEIFFVLSGYLVGAVYFAKVKQPSFGGFAAKVWRRAGKLYVYNLALFVALIPLCLASPDLARLGFYSWFFKHEPWSYVEFLLLYVQPYCLEILVTYIVLLATAPLFALLLRLQPFVALVASVGLYWYAHEHIRFNIPGGSPVGDWLWNFNPASWQALFFVAMAAGRWRILDWLRRKTQGNWWLLIAAWALFAGLTVLFLAQTWYGFRIDFVSKIRVGPVRTAHALSVIWAILTLFWMWPRLGRFWLFRQVAIIGSNSLQTFVACVAISYAAGYIWIEHARTHGAYIALCIGSVAVLGLVANGYARWKARAS